MTDFHRESKSERVYTNSMLSILRESFAFKQNPRSVLKDKTYSRSFAQNAGFRSSGWTQLHNCTRNSTIE